MAKAKVEITIKGDVQNESPYIITSALIREMKCSYGYEFREGATAGDKVPTRKGENLIHEDLRNAFEELKPHLAILDDAFKLLPKVKTFEDKAQHEIVEGYYITGFKVQGSDENVGYILIGDKHVEQGAIGFETPKITSASGYPYYSQLRESIEHVRNEVLQYMNGKCEIEDDPQLVMVFKENGGDGNEFNNPE